jgi:hypothetical protein
MKKLFALMTFSLALNSYSYTASYTESVVNTLICSSAENKKAIVIENWNPFAPSTDVKFNGTKVKKIGPVILDNFTAFRYHGIVNKTKFDIYLRVRTGSDLVRNFATTLNINDKGIAVNCEVKTDSVKVEVLKSKIKINDNDRNLIGDRDSATKKKDAGSKSSGSSNQ